MFKWHPAFIRCSLTSSRTSCGAKVSSTVAWNESYGPHLSLTILSVPCSLDSGRTVPRINAIKNDIKWRGWCALGARRLPSLLCCRHFARCRVAFLCIYMYISYMYIYMYIYTHTHTHIYIYIYIYTHIYIHGRSSKGWTCAQRRQARRAPSRARTVSGSRRCHRSMFDDMSGGNPGANLKSISHRCHLWQAAFE